MAKGINTNSKEWCDLVFQNRNKSYGAYRMRRTSSKRHIIAFAITLFSFTFLACLPGLIDMAKFYIFQHAASDYVIEDYDYITQNLTEIELMQMTKKYIPNPSETQEKVAASADEVQIVKDFKTTSPEIVDESLINDQDMDYYQQDTTKTETETKKPEETKTEVDDGLYLVVEEMPSFPGGEPGLMDYIYKNLRYSYATTVKKIESTVICTFIIDTDGSVKQTEIVQSAHPLLDKEALRVVNSLPKWKPAKRHGTPIRVKYTLPIIFRLK